MLAVNPFNADRKRMSILVKDVVRIIYIVCYLFNCVGILLECLSTIIHWCFKYMSLVLSPTLLVIFRNERLFSFITVSFLPLQITMQYFVMCKGADNIMLPLCLINNADLSKINQGLLGGSCCRTILILVCYVDFIC